MLSWRTTQRNAKIRAVEEFLGVNPDGTSVPLTLRQTLVFRTARNKLEYKLIKVRRAAREVGELVRAIEPYRVEVRDIQLLRAFVLECLSPFKRYVLRLHIYRYDENRRMEKVALWMWVVAWVLQTGALVFFIYWILSWGLVNGGETLTAWGVNFGIGLGNDMLIVAVAKIVWIQCLSLEAMQPQLRVIRQTFQDICMTYINRAADTEDPYDEDYGQAYEDERAGHLRVVQHLSAACRAVGLDPAAAGRRGR
jgi:hypothetical protein